MIATKIRNKSQELVRYREMFFGLVNREVRARYKGSVLGFLWSLLNPLLMMAIYSLVFSVYLRINIPHYAFFLFCGLLPWQWFATTVHNATAAVVANSNLIKKVYFPLEILPLVNVSTNFVNFIFSLPILLLFMVIWQLPLTWSLLFLPVLVAIQFLLTLGLALFLCTLNAFFRDVEQLIGPVMLAWFYVTPVVYQASQIPEKFSAVLYLNPLAPLIMSYQAIFYAGRPPEATWLLTSLVQAVVVFAIGYTVFYRKKFTFPEIV